MHTRLGVIGLVLALQGCANLTSAPSADKDLGDGLTYYLPKKDILLTIVVEKDKGITSVAVSTTSAYPDLKQAYVLRHERNLIGKTANNIGVDVNGLLKSTKAVATSGVSDALKNLAESSASIRLNSFLVTDVTIPCGVGTHTYIYPSTSAKDLSACGGLNVSIAKLTAEGSTASAQGKAAPPRETGSADTGKYSGIYYRQAEPYLVTVTGPINTASVVFSPSAAPLKSLSIARTFFATGDSGMDFTDGMPTKYDQTTEGELVALFKLPATIIASYFAAIGSVFDAFKTRDTKEADDLASSIKLELAKKKYDACIKAIQDKDDAAITKLECGK